MKSLKSRKGFGYEVRKAKRRPINVAIRDLLGSAAFTGRFGIFEKHRREDNPPKPRKYQPKILEELIAYK